MKGFYFENAQNQNIKTKTEFENNSNINIVLVKENSNMLRPTFDTTKNYLHNIANNHHRNFNKIKIELRPLVQILKIYGSYSVNCRAVTLVHPRNPDPVRSGSENRKDINNIEITYENTSRKWSSGVTWYSYGLKAFMFLALTTCMCNLAFDISFPFRAYSFGKTFTQFKSTIFTLNKSGILVNSVVKMLEVMFLHWNMSHFVDWLNNWSNFESEFFKCFSSVGFEFKFDIGKFRNLSCTFYFVLPSLMWLFVSMFGVIPEYNFSIQYFGQFIYIVAAMITWSYALLEDVKVFLMLKTLALSFEQILHGIRSVKLSLMSNKITNKINPEATLNLTRSEVVGWRLLLKSLKKQCGLASEHFKSQQLLLITEVISSCSSGIYFILMMILYKEKLTQGSLVTFIATSTWFCVNSFGRLFCKVQCAECILPKELQILDELEELEIWSLDIAVKSELKYLCSKISQNPVAINLGNYVTLEKKLLTTVIVQVVTYLIVIIQVGGL